MWHIFMRYASIHQFLGARHLCTSILREAAGVSEEFPKCVFLNLLLHWRHCGLTAPM